MNIKNNDESAASLLGRWSSNKGDGAFVVGLSGHLGAGKTAFVKRIAKILGVEEVVNSPTFVITKMYETDKANVPFKRLVHIDAYRLEKRSELEVLDLESLLSDANNLIMIEWPENAGLGESDVDELLRFEAVESDYGISF